uniref:DEAD/DEAH box helicase domain-containing protein n=1 Tax=Panagrolaimus superbus TaxID=310955 RepID=A0A914Y465_9BILA
MVKVYIQKTFADKKLPQSRADGNFEPILRDINAIYEEDIKHADEYAAIYDEDDQVIVEGLHGQNLTEIEEWDDACFFNQLKENIARTGYIHPRKIQRSVIPLILEGYNLKVQAETGTGKSAVSLKFIKIVNN